MCKCCIMISSLVNKAIKKTLLKFFILWEYIFNTTKLHVGPNKYILRDGLTRKADL